MVRDADAAWDRATRPVPGPDRSILGNNVAALAQDPARPRRHVGRIQPAGVELLWTEKPGGTELTQPDYPALSSMPSTWTPLTAPSGSEAKGGVTRYDGETWETLIVESVLPSTSIYAIARMQDGMYWFGSREGPHLLPTGRDPPLGTDSRRFRRGRTDFGERLGGGEGRQDHHRV